MRTRFRTVALALAAAAALALASTAAAAYTSPKLQVSQNGPTTVIAASQSQNDDATASARIFFPAGTQVTSNQPAGAKLGTVKATVTALALGGALLQLSGDLLVAQPGQVAAQAQQLCTGGAGVLAVWLMVLQAAGQTLNVPVFVMGTQGNEAALGPVKLQICLPPPDIPVANGGATFGAKLLTAELTLNGVVGPSPLAPWFAFWTPYQAGNGQVNVAGTVVSPAVIAPGAIAMTLTKVGALRTRLSGQVSQAGQPLPGATVQIWAGKTRTGIKRITTVKTNAQGLYTVTTANRGAFFAARAVVGARATAELCQRLQPSLPAPCVNGQVNGFTQTSAIKKR